jgi:hypothetical protein
MQLMDASQFPRGGMMMMASPMRSLLLAAATPMHGMAFFA